MNTPEITILRHLLTADNGFVSGNRLAEELGISRVAVWGHMEKLRGQGFEFEAVRSRGYRLVDYPRELNPLLTRAHLTSRSGTPDIIYLPEVDSTNSEAERQLALERPTPFVVMAGSQKQGRGRLGRTWHSDHRGNLYISFAFRPNLHPSRMQAFTLWMGVNVCEALANFCRIDAGIKWPNDILYHGRKLGGMLTEARIDADRTRDVVFGLGLNINGRNPGWPSDVTSRSISVSEATGQPIDANRLTAVLITRIIKAFKHFADDDYQKEMQSMWEKFDQLAGRKISALRGSEHLKGQVKGIDSQGALLLTVSNGKMVTLHAGEVTLEKE